MLINGEPVPYALARIPHKHDFRGNLAAGASGEGRELSERDLWICEQVGPTLREKGLLFVGLDVIGDYLTEINVTSPTCVRELDRLFNLDIAGISASGGSACTSGSDVGSHVLRGIGCDVTRPAVRFSFSKYNTKEEVDYVVSKLKELFPTEQHAKDSQKTVR